MLITYLKGPHRTLSVITHIIVHGHCPDSTKPKKTKNSKPEAKYKKPSTRNQYQKENAHFRGRSQTLTNEAYSSASSAAIRFTSS